MKVFIDVNCVAKCYREFEKNLVYYNWLENKPYSCYI